MSIVLTVATLSINVVRAGEGPAKSEDKPSVAASVVTLLPGLNRQRPAFRKAMQMLASGAASNPGLADYYQSVRRRLKGESDSDPVPSVRKLDSEAQSPVNDFLPLEHVSMLSSDQPVQQSAGQDATPAQTPEHPAGSSLTARGIKLRMNPAIERWTTYYTSTPKGRRTMKLGLQRSSAYIEMARAEFRKAGVPEDLVWLAFVESLWNPKAKSPAAAGGLWQFLPVTAREYGLKVQRGNDERSDPAKQTRVAAQYLHDLYIIFGDWDLSMAAYNGGEPRVMGAIVRNGGADFWGLCDKQLLPRETRDYVPKILASISIVSQPEVYGLTPDAGRESIISAGA